MKPAVVVVIVVSVFGCLFCGGGFLLMATSRPVPAPRAAPVPPPAPAVPTTPAPPPPNVVRFSYLKFVDARPDECADFTIIDEPGSTAAADAALARLQPLVANLTRIPVSCAEQFPGRPIFATCDRDVDRTTDAGVRERIAFKASYFDWPTLRDSTYAQDCLRDGGRWSELPRSDRAVIEAEGDEARRELEVVRRRIGR